MIRTQVSCRRLRQSNSISLPLVRDYDKEILLCQNFRNSLILEMSFTLDKVKCMFYTLFYAIFT